MKKKLTKKYHAWLMGDKSRKHMSYMLHLMYGSILLTFVIPSILSLFGKGEFNLMRLSMVLWVGQTWFYAASNLRLREACQSLRQNMRELKKLSTELSEVNNLFIKRLAKMDPALLKEAGISIKKI